MAEPFKNRIGAPQVQALAAAFRRSGPGFDARRFGALALEGLDALELKARAVHVSHALEATLPAAFEAAAVRLDHVLQNPAGLEDFALWPVGEFIARRGLADPERALALLRTMTPHFTAEFAIRPFIVEHPALVFATLARWTQDPDEAVRRLASEGSRPRLPWGLRLQALVADPAPTLPVLEALQDDPSASVRLSVANHLNDIAKDHPQLLADWLERHLPGANAQRSAMLRHASRSLIKQGERRVLAAWGLDRAFRGEAQVDLAPVRLAIGEAFTLRLRLVSTSSRNQRLEVDYAVHHVKADGRNTPKVFKGWRIELAPHATLELVKRHSMRPVTTRRYHPGPHPVSLRINGRVVAETGFVLD